MLQWTMLTAQTRPVAEALLRFALARNITFEHLLGAVTLDELLTFLPVYEAYVPDIREHTRRKLSKLDVREVPRHAW